MSFSEVVDFLKHQRADVRLQAVEVVASICRDESGHSDLISHDIIGILLNLLDDEKVGVGFKSPDSVLFFLSLCTSHPFLTHITSFFPLASLNL